MNRSMPTHLLTRFRFLNWLLIGVWTGCIAGSLLWNLQRLADRNIDLARLTAQVTFENDVLYRRWSAQQGGVYVRASAGTPPNPYLQVPERDVITTSGTSLTLVNPAYMARQVNALAGGTAGSRGHLTSLKPIRPENAPDPWEAAALRSLERGGSEVSSVEQMPGGEYLRLMRPFVTERSCLVCHAAQGYREGDIRGGISVSVPMAPLRAITKPMTDHLTMVHAGLWLIGLAGVGVYWRSLGKEILARERVSADLQREVAERRSAEGHLREANDRYELVLAGAEAGLWDWDVPRHKVVFSPRWKAMRGLAEDEVSDAEEEWSEGIHPEDAPRVTEAVQAHFAGRTPFFAEEYRVRRKDGSWMWIADRGLARRDATGRVLRMAGSETDITERKRAEEALRESERRYRDLVENANSAIIRWRRDGTVTFFNEYAQRFFGYSAAEVLGRHVGIIVPSQESTGADLSGLCREIVLHPDRYTNNVNENVCRDGRHVWMTWTNRPILDEHGEVAEILAVGSDITVRKQAEEALAKQREELELILDSTPACIFYKDEQNRFVRVNRAFADIMGRPKEELAGCSMSELYPREQADAYWKDDQEVMASGMPKREIVEPMLSPQGERWFQTDKVPCRDAQGSVIGVIGFSLDITERRRAEERLRHSTAELQAANASLLESRRAALKLMEDALAARQCAEQVSAELRQEVAERRRAEDALRESESFHRQTLESIPGMVFTTRPDGYCEYQSQQWVDFTGVPMAEHLGDGWNRLLHPEDRPRAFAAWRDAVEERAPYDIEYRVRRRDGAYEWFKVRGRPIRDESGQIVRWFGTALNIDSLVKMEEALRRSEHLYRAIGETIDYGIWICDPDGRNTYASESFLKLVGLTQEQCSSFGWGDVLHPDDAERTVAAWKECVRAGGTWDVEHRYRGADGRWHPILARGVPVRDEEGRVLCWAGINLDIGRLKRAEEHLKASLREKEVLLQEVHHRVKNNLQVISSLISLQADALDDPVLHTSLNDVRDRVRTMALVHEKLYQSGDLARLDFAEYAASLLHYLWRAHGAAAAKAQLILRTQPVTLPVGLAVSCGLILNELAGNALKHAFRGRAAGEVTVRLERDPENQRVCLGVSDDGVGLPAGLDVRHSPSLGLRLVQMLTQQIGGTLEVGIGPGAEFRITFVPLEGS